MRLIPPVWFALAAAGMLALHRFLPGIVLLPEPYTWLGLFPALAGFVLMLYAAVLFVRAGTPLEPWKTPQAFVVSGPYRYSRNPMYLGLSLCLLGWAMWLGSATPLLLLPAFGWVITALFVRREERALAQRFGDDWRAYEARVRRWI